MMMSRSKTIDRICCLALVVMLALTAVIWVCKALAGKQKTVEVGYEGLFDSSVVHTIDIEIADWDSFITSASQEEYTECTVTIDGEKLSGVGIRAKGNTSLSSVSALESEKYSFKIEFDHFMTGRLFHGLDKLSLNNLIYDATMMKDYLAYTLMAKMDVPSPLGSYAEITVNNEPWGLYLAVEGVEDGFLERNNLTTGELYKPDSMSFGGGRGNGRDFDFEQFRVKEEETSDSDQSSTQITYPQNDNSGFTFPVDGIPNNGNFSDFSGSFPEGMTPSDAFIGMSLSSSVSQDSTPQSLQASGENKTPPQRPDGEDVFDFQMPNFGGKFNFGMGSSDVKLNYTDDDPDNYSNIFNNAKTNISKKDKTRLIETLKTLNSEDAQEAVDADEVIAYLAVHDFLQNDDSYTGMMVHNYYLYEDDGILTIIPWDYNLAFGGFGGSASSTSTVNSPIDSPVSSGNTSDRPLISWIFNNADTLEKYHEVYDLFVSSCIENGWLQEEIERISVLIHPYVESDENSFYTVDEFNSAIEVLQEYVKLRSESIRSQLNGIIPSTSEGQSADSTTLVTAESLDLSIMGAMNQGGNNQNGGMPSFPGGGSPGAMPSLPGKTSFDIKQPVDHESPNGGPPAFSGGDVFTKPDNNLETEGSSEVPETFVENEELSNYTTAQAEALPISAEVHENTNLNTSHRFQSPPTSMESFPMSGMGSVNTRDRINWIPYLISLLILLSSIIIVSRIKGHNG